MKLAGLVLVLDRFWDFTEPDSTLVFRFVDLDLGLNLGLVCSCSETGLGTGLAHQELGAALDLGRVRIPCAAV